MDASDEAGENRVTRNKVVSNGNHHNKMCTWRQRSVTDEGTHKLNVVCMYASVRHNSLPRKVGLRETHCIA